MMYKEMKARRGRSRASGHVKSVQRVKRSGYASGHQGQVIIDRNLTSFNTRAFLILSSLLLISERFEQEHSKEQVRWLSQYSFVLSI